MKQTNQKINKPRYIGACILDDAKTSLYEFHYDHIKQHFPGSTLVMTDTDSALYHIYSEEDPYKILKEKFNDIIDFSNYDPSGPFYDTWKKMVPGKVKDEFGGNIILEAIGLRSKMYSILWEKEDGQKEKKTAKGVKRHIQKSHLHHQDYLNCFFNNVEGDVVSYFSIRSLSQVLYTLEEKKRTLSPLNDKRFMINAGKIGDGDPIFMSFAFHNCILKELELS